MGEALTAPLEEAFMSRTTEGEVRQEFVIDTVISRYRMCVCHGSNVVRQSLYLHSNKMWKYNELKLCFFPSVGG